MNSKEKKQNQVTIQFNGRFIADMAYQIRTLSNAIIGFSELLLYEELTDSQTEYVNDICHAGQCVASLIGDVQDLSKIEAGQFKVDTLDCSLGWLLDKIDSSVRPLADEKGVDFTISQCTDLPANIRTDPAKLCQCLINLAGNAVKFTEAGSVNLKVSLEQCDGKAFVRFDVVDSGTAIPTDEQKTIFEPFAQVNGSIFAKSGLELTITSHLAKLLGGTLSFTSEPTGCSIFSFVIPAGVNIETEPLLQQRKLVTSLPQPETAADMQCVGHILLAEYEPSNRTGMTLLLETMGMRVSVAEDGVQAVQKATDEQFDLILMDIKMPNMDGYEATRILREKGLVTPVIALTAASASDNADSYTQTDFNCFLTKPVDRKKLYETISVYLPVIRALDSDNQADISAESIKK